MALVAVVAAATATAAAAAAAAVAAAAVPMTATVGAVAAGSAQQLGQYFPGAEDGLEAEDHVAEPHPLQKSEVA